MVKTLLVVVALMVSVGAAAKTVAPAVTPLSARESPVPVTGTVTIEKSQADVQREAEGDKTKSATDDAMLRYTGWTAIFTGIMAVIALAQGFMFFWQLRLMRQSSDVAEAAANAARDSAKVARDTFTTLERPWIFLQAHRVIRREGAPIQPQLLNNFWVALVFKNNGRSPAMIRDLIFTFHETDTLPAVPDYSLCQGKLNCPSTLPAGNEFETNRVGRAPGENVQYTIYGKLTYDDMAGTEHHTCFAIDISSNLPAASTNQNRLYDFHD